MSKFNGHKNWNHWNVSLWINNDENLYREALFQVCHAFTRQKAAQGMLDFLHDLGITHTPDGAPYSKTSIIAAMRGI